MRVTGGRLVELRNGAGPGGRPRAGAVVDRVQLQVLRTIGNQNIRPGNRNQYEPRGEPGGIRPDRPDGQMNGFPSSGNAMIAAKGVSARARSQ